ncbi:hypothetical protein [Pedobacter nototheniae]|uniref:hypothetical protein n=1 Tax=Pedobacter nototheniae TaxID=2488994 RepID=UPI00292D86AB|nr:hypothetical protein [Pedobacter nototheniae]
METAKLSFTTHEVNELIGGVPKKILWYCLGILLATIVGVCLMISITPYPKNLTVKASIVQEADNQAVVSSGILSKKNGSLICKLQFDKNSLNERYLNNIKTITITFYSASKKYRLIGTVYNVFRKKEYIVADAKLSDNDELRKFLNSDNKLLRQELSVELTNDRFSIKDKLESNFSIK